MTEDEKKRTLTKLADAKTLLGQMSFPLYPLLIGENGPWLAKVKELSYEINNAAATLLADLLATRPLDERVYAPHPHELSLNLIAGNCTVCGVYVRRYEEGLLESDVAEVPKRTLLHDDVVVLIRRRLIALEEDASNQRAFNEGLERSIEAVNVRAANRSTALEEASERTVERLKALWEVVAESDKNLRERILKLEQRVGVPDDSAHKADIETIKERRRAAGLCVVCGDPADHDEGTCSWIAIATEAYATADAAIRPQRCRVEGCLRRAVIGRVGDALCMGHNLADHAAKAEVQRLAGGLKDEAGRCTAPGCERAAVLGRRLCVDHRLTELAGGAAPAAVVAAEPGPYADPLAEGSDLRPLPPVKR